MASDKPSYSGFDEGLGPQPNKATVSFAAGKSEIIYRIFGAVREAVLKSDIYIYIYTCNTKIHVFI